MKAKLSKQCRRTIWNPYIVWFIKCIEDTHPESPTIDIVGNYIAYWTEDNGSIMDQTDEHEEEANMEEVMIM